MAIFAECQPAMLSRASLCVAPLFVLFLMQAMVEDLLKEYPNVLILRVRMPIVADLTYPRNFITKIIKYDKVHTLAA